MKLKQQLLFDYYVGGAAHVVLKPWVYLLGKVLRIRHSLKNLREITVIKMVGGGSLVIAYPALLALKAKTPRPKLNLVTTPAIKPFAEMLGIFDEIIVIRTDRLTWLLLDSIKAIARTWRVEALVDLEIHSRLSSIFSLLTCAVNRIGIYTELSFWRRSLYTHLLFYNKFSPIYLLYDQVAHLLGAEPVDFESAKQTFKAKFDQVDKLPTPKGPMRMGVAPGCSDLSKERMLRADQWSSILKQSFAQEPASSLCIIGSGQDRSLGEEIIAKLKADFPEIDYTNVCGNYSLSESIGLINRLDTLYCIDSSLIHFARLLGVKTISYWGPTDPRIMLRPDPSVPGQSHYVRLACSPCVHIASETPCRGNNLCMTAAAQSENYTGERNPIWLAFNIPEDRS